METTVERQCPVCERPYLANATRLKFGRQTTCSRKCSYALRAQGLMTATMLSCGACGKPVHAPPSKVARVHHEEVFCSRKCAYAKRQRVVTLPYRIVAVYDRAAAGKRAWATRRSRGAPRISDETRASWSAHAVARILRGGSVSKFEQEVAATFRRLGFGVLGSLALRGSGGRYAHVFDLYIGARRIVVECHGTYWHGGRWSWDEPDGVQRRNLAYEERKVLEAKRLGFDLRLLWEHDFKADPVGACLAAVR